MHTQDTQLYTSSDNGQIACKEHKALYGRIPWRKMPQSDIDWLTAELAKTGITFKGCEECAS